MSSDRYFMPENRRVRIRTVEPDQLYLDQIMAELEDNTDEEFINAVLDAKDVLLTLKDDSNPLLQYGWAARRKAAEALRRLPDLDPTDVKAVCQLQAEVREYLSLHGWIVAHISNLRALTTEIEEDSRETGFSE